MNSIVNMFYDLDNSSVNKMEHHSKHKNNLIYTTPALNQGANFKNYQNKIKNIIKKDIKNVNNREGFQNNDSSSNTSTSNTSTSNTSLANQSNQVLSETSSGTDNSLQIEYNVTLSLYQKLLKKVSRYFF